MDFALSTHWNAARHADGQKMIEEIIALGFSHVELGYDLRMDLVPGVQAMVKSGAIKVNSLHNYCPVPVGAPKGHPELFTLASTDLRERQSAIHHTGNTIRFAAEIGTKAVVTHAGNVEMTHLSRDLFDLLAQNRQFTSQYEKIKMKMIDARDRKAPKQIIHLEESLLALLPVLETCNVTLAIENLPTWESIPTEMELETLLKKINSPRIRFWYDVGHGQIRQNLGLINLDRWLERLNPFIAGMHVHDVAPPASDHVMPPRGQVDFGRLQRFVRPDMILVIEPSSRTPAEEVKQGLDYLKQAWADVTSVQA